MGITQKEMEKIKNMKTTQFSNLETKTMTHLRNLEETTVKNLQTVNNELQVEMKKHMRELVDSFTEDLRPLMKDMEEFGKFKESTIKHLVSLTKQIQDLQKEVDTAKQSISNSIQTFNQQIDSMKSEISGSLDNNNDDLNSNNSKNSNNNNSNNNNSNNNNSNNNKIETDEQLESLRNKVKNLEKRSEMWESKFQSSQGASNAPDFTQPATTPYELQLQKRKKNNLIIFGLKENDQDANQSDKNELQSLVADLESTVSLDETQFFRVGRNLGRCRPLVLKLKNECEKAEILFLAKSLKNKRKWQGVSITHDLTKLQCQEEKAREVELRSIAEERNRSLPGGEKSKEWKVVGGRGTRRLMLRDT